MNDGPVKLELLSEISEDSHEHAEIELIYVVEGTCTVTYSKKTYVMEKEDILIVNTEREHSICAEQEALICKISFPYYDICRQLGEDYVLFRCNSVKEQSFKYIELNRQMKELLLEYAKNSSRQLYRFYGQCYLLLSYLLDQFKMTGIRIENGRQWEDGQKLVVIKNYIHEHYMDGGSLSVLADKLFLSQSALSRYFKKMTGESFVKYVQKVRLQKAVEQLITTDLPITRIAVDNGFSTPSSLNKEFKEYYGTTPGEYREKNKAEREKKQEKNIQFHKKRLIEILGIEMQEESEKDNGIIWVDLSDASEYKKWKTKIINVGEAADLKNADMQKHVLIFRQKLDAEYVRIWTLFSNSLLLKEEGQVEYNFHQIDHILDFCVDHGLKLFLEMGQRTHIAMSSEREYLYKQENGMEFHSQEEWMEMMESFFRHIQKRYSEEILNEWIIEFTFFLNKRPYYISDNYSSRRVWEQGYEIVRKYLPNAKIAGPGLTAGMDSELLHSIIDSFFGTAYMPDIFTSYNFPYQPTGEEYQYRRVNEVDFLKRQIRDIKKELSGHGFLGKYYVTDWNYSLANRNYVQDSCFRGTLILKSILDNYESVDEMGIWYVSDLLNFYYDSYGVLSGSGGLISKDGICKPSFYALLFLKEIGKYKVAQGENYLITKNSGSDIYILCYNNKSLGIHYYLLEENMYQPDEIEKLFQNRDRLKLTIELKNLEEDGNYMVRQKIINEEAGSILNKWELMEFERDLVYEDMEYLRKVSVPEIQIGHIRVQNKRFRLNVMMEPDEIRLIMIRKD